MGETSHQPDWGTYMNEADFTDFVTHRAPALLRTAFLLCGGDRGAAEDLLQEVLERAYPRWRRIQGQTGVRTYGPRWRTRPPTAGGRRSRRVSEVPLDEAAPATGPGHEQQIVDHDQVVRALRTLPPRMRAVLVLRFFDDMSEAESRRHCAAASAPSRARPPEASPACANCSPSTDLPSHHDRDGMTVNTTDLSDAAARRDGRPRTPCRLHRRRCCAAAGAGGAAPDRPWRRAPSPPPRRSVAAPTRWCHRRRHRPDPVATDWLTVAHQGRPGRRPGVPRRGGRGCGGTGWPGPPETDRRVYDDMRGEPHVYWAGNTPGRAGGGGRAAGLRPPEQPAPPERGAG